MKLGLKSGISMILMLAATACATPPAGAPAAGGTPAAAGGAAAPVVLKVARSADASVWDPKYTNDNDSLWSEGQIFATLLQNSPDGTKIEPWLADKFDVNADATVFTFHLHDNAKFCDGTPITADDVKFSFDRAMEKDSSVSWQYPSNAKVEVIDPLSLKITLSESNVAFPSYLTLWGTNIVSKAYFDKVGKDVMAEKPLGSGPFCLDSWDKGQKMIFKANPGYWGDDRGNVTEVDFSIVTDDNARVLQIQSGEVDAITSFPNSQFDGLKSADGVKVYTDTLYGLASIPMNEKTVPQFADKKIRQAMAYAIDRQAIVDAVLFGQGQVGMSPFDGAGVLYWTDKYGIAYDLDKAKALMAESSSPKGFATELTIKSGDSVAQQTAVILKDQLSKIGIDLTITPVEPGTWWDNWSSGNFQMIYKLSTNDIIDPSENIPFDFWSKEEGGSDGAFTGYHNADLVKLTQAATAELDTTKRAALYDEIQKIAMDDSSQLWLFHPANLWAARDDVKNFTVFPTGNYHLWQVSKGE